MVPGAFLHVSSFPEMVECAEQVYSDKNYDREDLITYLSSLYNIQINFAQCIGPLAPIALAESIGFAYTFILIACFSIVYGATYYLVCGPGQISSSKPDSGESKEIDSPAKPSD